MLGRRLGLGTALLATSVLTAVWYPHYAEGRSNAKLASRGRGSPASDLATPLLRTPKQAAGAPDSPPPVQARIEGPLATSVPGIPRIFGQTTSGCITGSVVLPAQGDGFVLRRPWRATNFGHPDLVDYIKRMGESSRQAGLGTLLIGDMSLPGGGAFMHGHFSHQTGLDVDIAYESVAPHLIAGAHRRSRLGAGPPWDARRIEGILRLAAGDERVDRIYVGAGIKELLCRTVGDDREFLDRLRPWWGHERHFHVRLRCPADSPECRPNQPTSGIPDDCQSLSSWWKSAEVQPAFARWRAGVRVAYDHDLPRVCQSLFDLARDSEAKAMGGFTAARTPERRSLRSRRLSLAPRPKEPPSPLE
jgi:penicillin-insensitive murein endopeptidase